MLLASTSPVISQVATSDKLTTSSPLSSVISTLLVVAVSIVTVWVVVVVLPALSVEVIVRVCSPSFRGVVVIS